MYDFGCGDGRFLVEAVKSSGARAVRTSQSINQRCQETCLCLFIAGSDPIPEGDFVRH